MQLSTKGRYAVMAMVDLAKHASKGAAMPLVEIAARRIVVVPEIPLLPTGKPDRRALAALAATD